jgi:ribosomal protein S18 acetylase RimI-like enzyme/nitroimidazol reductase NimA-like FMN-containing flavoprotein (pyridoxamine 5'-phosphate oxidase superfamily)
MRSMRKAIYRGTDDDGLALFSRAEAVHLAMVSEDGGPILRTVNAVIVDGVLAFHGAPAGEKMEGFGRPVIAAAEETVASIPSYFLDPERACPATTFYLSAQIDGVLEQVHDPDRKARVLAALMAKYQPEGGHEPLSAHHPLYEKAIAGLLVAEIRGGRLSCKAKLGQNRRPEERLRVLEQLWRRGAPGDVEAVGTVLARAPELGAPSFLRPRPELHERGFCFQCAIDEAEVNEVIALLDGAYWLDGVPDAVIRRAVLASSAVVAARDAKKALVGFARAVSDGRCAWIYDVVVAPALRGAQVGSAIMAVLLDHPAVRDVRQVRLGTRDAIDFYRRLGFCDLAEAPRPYAWRPTEMIRMRR